MAGLAVLLAAALSLALAAPASDDCRACKGRGLVACDSHPSALAEHEFAAEYCSEIADCESCGGAGWTDCEKCERPEADAWLEAKRTAVRTAPDELAWIEESLGRAAPVAMSSDFTVVWEPEKLKGVKGARGAHALRHHYLAKLDELMAAYRTALGHEGDEFPERIALLVWAEQEDQEKVSEALCEEESEYLAKRYGLESVVTLCGDRKYYKSAKELDRALVHQLGHVFPTAQKPAAWVGDKRGGWVDAGFAHWFEDSLEGACEEVCFNAFYYKDQVRPNKWRDHVKKLVARDKVPDLELVLIQNTETLTFEYHVVAFSLVDYLIARDPRSFDRLMKRMRSRTPTRDALYEVYQLSLEDFGEAWREWVRETY